MRRVLAVLAIFALPVHPQEPDEPEVPVEEIPDEPPPELPKERILRGERDAPAEFVRIREGGILEWKSGEEWRETTLDDLSTILGRARDRHELEQRQRDKSVFKEPPRLKSFGIFLSIEADPDVPWQQVQWIMTIAAEQKIRKLEMSQGTRRLLASVPTDAAIEYAEGYEPPREVDVHVVVRAEQPAKWGEVDVRRPTELRYKCGDEETTDLADVIAYLKKAKAEAEKKRAAVFGEIKAGQKVPYARVFDVMEAFVAAEYASSGFYGTAIPPKAIREARRLPYPKKNYATAND